MKKTWIACAALLLFFSCQKNEERTADSLKIAVSIYPVYDIVKNLAAKDDTVIYIIPPGANPHTYEPAPSSIKDLVKSDIFIGISHEFDGWIEKFLSKKTIKKYLSGDDDHENPHIWLSIKNSKKIVRPITALLVSCNKKNEALYHKKMNSYIRELDNTEKKIKNLLSGLHHRKIIQFHPAWDYFADEFNLEIISTIESGHGKTPSVKKFSEIIQKAKENNVKFIATGLGDYDSSVITLAREIGGTIIRLDTIGSPDSPERSTYIKMMLYNAKKIHASMKNK